MISFLKDQITNLIILSIVWVTGVDHKNPYM